jgi:hypothetical protein
MRHVAVGIIGCGIGGLATAVALGRRGFTVRLFERSDHLNESGSALVLPPNVVAALDALAPELSPAVRSAGRCYPATATVPSLASTGRVFAPDSVHAVSRSCASFPLPLCVTAGERAAETHRRWDEHARRQPTGSLGRRSHHVAAV